MKITVVIVEDERHYSKALRKIIDFDEELLCLGQFYTGNDAIEGLSELQPDVVLMDIKLPDMSGIEAMFRLKPMMENTQFLMCTSFEDDEHIYDSLRFGASGYLIKGESLEKIIIAIKDVFTGGAPMSFGIAKRVLNYFRDDKSEIGDQLNDLSKTEHEILDLLAQGLYYKEIAEKKEITLDTVKKHAGNIYKKLHVNNKIEAINLFKKH